MKPCAWAFAVIPALIGAAALLLPAASHAQVAAGVRASASGQCMNVAGNSLLQEAAVIQWPCVGAANERWQVEFSGGYYTFKVSHSGQCLDVDKANTAPGTGLVQWACRGRPTSSSRCGLSATALRWWPATATCAWASAVRWAPRAHA